MGVFSVFLERKGKAFPEIDTLHFDFFPKHFEMPADCQEFSSLNSLGFCPVFILNFDEK